MGGTSGYFVAGDLERSSHIPDRSRIMIASNRSTIIAQAAPMLWIHHVWGCLSLRSPCTARKCTYIYILYIYMYICIYIHPKPMMRNRTLGWESHLFSLFWRPSDSQDVSEFIRSWCLEVFAGASGAKLNVSGPASRWALNVFLQVPLTPNSTWFCRHLRRQSRCLKKVTLGLWRWYCQTC